LSATILESLPYYVAIDSFSIGNKEKGQFGEQAFAESVKDYTVLLNIQYGKRQKDIDHLVLTSNSVIMNECKNTSTGFFMVYSWFCSHVADRFADGLPVAQHYANTLGYRCTKIDFTLTIPS
jgi:hypothetical protein